MTHIPALIRMAAYFLACRLGVMKIHRLPGQQDSSPKGGKQRTRHGRPPLLGPLSSSVGYPDGKLANRKAINFIVMKIWA